MNSNALYNLSYGLFVLTARENTKDNGCIVNTVIQVTTSPNRILVAVNKKNHTHDMILRTSEFNVSILTEHAAFDTFKHGTGENQCRRPALQTYQNLRPVSCRIYTPE